MELSSGGTKNNYANKIISINEKLNAKEQEKNLPNYHLLVKQYSENAQLQEELLKNDPNQKSKLSNTYWNLSWYQIFYKDFEGAERSVKKGIELYPLNDGMNTNLALSYLLRKNFTAAEAIYRAYKGKRYSSRSRYFTDVFLQDLIDLEAAGIISSSDAEIYQEVTKIKAILMGK
jgi:tetratricopeptide (TPR) repeat protein